MSSKYIKKHTIPEGFPDILTCFTKEILRNQPLDIIDFSCEYFKCLQEGLLLDYPNKGQKIPCDFREPFVPKLSKDQSKIPQDKYDNKINKYDRQKDARPPSERSKISGKSDNLMKGGGVMGEEEEEENILMEGGGVMGEEEEENILMEGGGVMGEEEEGVEDEGNDLIDAGGIIIDDEDDDDDNGEEDEGNDLIDAGGIIIGGESDDEDNYIEDTHRKSIYDKVDEEEGNLMVGGGRMGDEEEEEEEGNLMEGGGMMGDEEEDDEDNNLIVRDDIKIEENEGEGNENIQSNLKVEGDINIEEKEEEGNENIQSNLKIEGVINIEDNEGENDNINEKKSRLLATGTNLIEIKDATPPHTLTDFKLDHYENCIDFPDKEEQLELLKNEESVSNYIEKVFNPNKNLNNILIDMQNALMSYYENKGTDNESKFNDLNNEIKEKLNEVNLPIFESDYKSKDINEAINDFKSFDYYPRATRVYSMKLENPVEENNVYLDEFCFFLFNHKLKDLVDSDNAKEVIEKYPYVKKYFEKNIELLEPEIYSFVLNSQFYPEDEFCNKYSAFNVRKRELCSNFYKLHNINNNSPEVQKCIENMDNYHYISSPNQINDKLDTINDSNKEELNDLIQEKLEKNYKKIWGFIKRVTNCPIELIEEAFPDFMSYKPVERDIIIKYLSLDDDHSDIHEKLSNLQIDPDDSEFNHKMKELNLEIEHSPELNYRNMCIYRNKLFPIPEKTRNYIDKCESSELNEDELFNEYKNLTPLSQDGVFYYLLIKSKEDDKYNNLIKKIQIEKEKREAKNFVKRGKTLLENFTKDSDEFLLFERDYKNWKENTAPQLNQYFNTEDNGKDDYFNNNLNENEEQVVVDMMQIENIIDENLDYNNKISGYKKVIKEKKKSSGTYEGLESDTDKELGEGDENYMDEEENDG